ncbi:DUF1161 domain-containing protein [Variovorax sp. OV329]|uniref:DUF1161 domain-containing protein n=1 Tax=Variovorax sp. OV329 TaxID=1882825 RepID=UPI0008E7A164|nr:DUF1161 domain-containing protein [Variovorax sp. OV329]SFN33895.1 Protein of unknown function [Variovorax sp. OV329]
MKTLATISAALLLAWGSAGHAQSSGCDAIKAQIDAKVRASGVNDFVLSVVEADAPAGGRVVGSCELGTKKIMYERTGTASSPGTAPAPAPRAKSQPIITECKDGSVSVGGNCKP